MFKQYTNGKINPLGIDGGKIRLSIEGEFNSKMQSVRFNVFTEDLLEVNAEPILTVASKKNYTYIDGENFSEGQRLFWNAEITTESEKLVTKTAFFEIGITRNKSAELWIENPNFCGKVSEFRRSFNLSKLPDKARLYIVGLGYYHAKVNGQETDEKFFKPLLTDFDYRIGIDNIDYDEENFYNDKKTVCYDTFDVLSLLKEGENNLSVLLGTGWYCNDDKLITDPCDRFGLPKLFFELHLSFGKEKEIIYSDEKCLVRNTNRISQLFNGDRIDFTAVKDQFTNTVICPPPSGKLVEPKCPHDGIIEQIKPLSEIKKNGEIEYDFGKNHSGGLALKVRGKRGAILTVQFYEVKDENGLNEHTSEWIAYDVTGAEPVPVDVVYQKDEYVLSGEEDYIYPLFHFNCYRYATVKCDAEFEVLSITSLFISTDVEANGGFTCSDEFITKYHEAFVLTQRDNMHSGIPSDCPHREKLPYTGDGNLAMESTMYNLNAEEFYRKWLLDVLDAQGNNGWSPYTAPYIGGAGGYWWSNVITALPVKLYLFTGDKGLIEKSFIPALKYIEYCNTVHNGDYILRKSFVRWILGEWLNPTVTEVDVAFINTLAFYSAVNEVVFMCDVLGEKERKKELQALSENIKKAINLTFYDKELKVYSKGVQGENLLPVVFGVAPKEDEEEIWNKIVNGYKTDTHFDTGIILTPVLLEALTERGEFELAYKLMTAYGTPSLRNMLDGETTLCEHWNKTWPKVVTSEDGKETGGGGDVSHCHPMYGSVVSWMHKHVAGLNLSKLYKNKIIFRPSFIEFVESASAFKETAFGLAKVSYCTEKGFMMTVKVPYGIIGEVILPYKTVKNITVGEKDYSFSDTVDGLYKITLDGGEYVIKTKA